MLRVRTAISGWAGGPGLMTQYFETPLQDAAAALRAVAYVHGHISAVMLGCFPDSVSLQVSGDVDVITAATGAIIDTLSVATPAVQVGVGSSAKAAPSVAVLLKTKTASFVSGRRVIGRTFISPLAAEVVDDNGQVSVTQQGIVGAIGANVLGALDAGDSWVVWHRPKAGAGGGAYPIVATSCPWKLAVLTSRRD